MAGKTGLPGPSTCGFSFLQKKQEGDQLFGFLQKEHHQPPDLVCAPLPPPLLAPFPVPWLGFCPGWFANNFSKAASRFFMAAASRGLHVMLEQNVAAKIPKPPPARPRFKGHRRPRET
eukprot:5890579-Amphidinium_carterae.1